MDAYRNLLERLYPLRRTLVSADMDQAVGMVADFARGLGLPDEHILVHEFPSGLEVSTWIVPERHTLNDFRLAEKNGRTILDRSSHPLSVAEYSDPVSGTFSFEELDKHLYSAPRRPAATPFVFRLFYRRDWGFCLPHAVYESLDREGEYEVLIDAAFEPGALKCLELVLPGESEESLLVMSNLCHPWQVNDSVTGAINALMLVEHFLDKPRRHTLRFGFWPETIGAQAYFSLYASQRHLFRQAVFTEMLGTPGSHALQYSRQEKASVDLAFEHALKARGEEYATGRYTTLLRNDERVSNGPNLDIPTVSLSRWPYPEYHTSDDTPDIVDMERLRRSFEVCRDALELLDGMVYLDAAPGLLGQPFLTRYGLFHDSPLAGGDPARNLNKITEDVFSYSDGTASLFDIAERFGHHLEDVERVARGLVEAGLFTVRQGDRNQDQ